MKSCPNKNNENWKHLVSVVGESKAYDIYNYLEDVPTIGIAPNGEKSILYEKLKRKDKQNTDYIWYSTLNPNNANLYANKDQNGEPFISDVIQDDIKSASYISSNPEISSVLDSTDSFIKKSLQSFANKAKAHPGNKAIGDVFSELLYLDVNKEINDINLRNLADALRIVLRYNDNILNAEANDKSRGGLITRLDNYLKQDLEIVMNDSKQRADFWRFLYYSHSFIQGTTVIKELHSIDSDSFSEEEKVINNVVKELEKLNAKVTNANNKYNELLQKAYEIDLVQYTSNPEIQRGLRQLFEITDDETQTQLLFDAMSDTHNPFVATLVKKYILLQSKAQKEWIKNQKTFADILHDTFNVSNLNELTEEHFDKYLDKDTKGNRTGKLIQKYDYNRFEEDKRNFFNSVSYLYKTNKEEYIKRVAKWYQDNEQTIVSKEEVLKIIDEKRNTLTVPAFNEWLKRNTRQINGELIVKMGDHIFKEPANKYLNKNWEDIKDDPLYNYLINIISEISDIYGRETILTKGYIPTLTAKQKETNSIINNTEVWLKTQIDNLGAKSKSRMFIGDNDQIIRILDIPMIEFFSEEKPVEYRKKTKDETFEDWQKEVIQDVKDSTGLDFKTFAEIKEYNREVMEKNQANHAGKINYNLYEVINKFIKEGTTFKYKNNMKAEVDLALHQIGNMKMHKRSGKGGLLSNIAASKAMGKKITQVESGEDSNLQKHYEEWLEAIFYENFDIDEGNLTKVVNLLMKYSSAKSMWLNLTAGVSNIAMNRAQLRAEAMGSYYFNNKDLATSDRLYTAAIIDMMANNGEEERKTVVGAIIKLYDITQNTNEKDYASGMLHTKLLNTDTMYMFNNIGEHYTQNNALLSMLNSHRVVNGDIISINDFRYDNYKIALNNILNEEEQTQLTQYWTDRYEKEEFKDGKKDYLRDFLLTLPIEKLKEFNKEKTRIDKESEIEFKKYSKAIDAYSLEKGMAVWNDSVTIEGVTYDTKLNELAQERFRYRVLKVNQKNNGIYNKDDSNTISRRALGKAIMQFHKYIRSGWNKRFGTRFGKSHWQEGRDEWDKGQYFSLFELMGSGYKGNPLYNKEDGLMFHKFLGRFLSGMAKFSTNAGIYYNTLDDFEKANVKRTLTELSFLTATIAIGLLLKGMKPKDDKKELLDYGYDLICYQNDRLMSELMFFTPIGWVNETQKLLRSPAAVQGVIVDSYKFIASAFAYPFQSEEGRIYQTGMYQDEYKIKVAAMRLIPIVNKYQQLKRLDKFNKYYILFRG